MLYKTSNTLSYGIVSLSPRSTDQTDTNLATILGVIFGIIGFIVILCLFTCCCGACRVRSIHPGEDVEKGSTSISISGLSGHVDHHHHHHHHHGNCNGGMAIGEGRAFRSPRQAGHSWRLETREEETRDRFVGGRGRGGGVNGVRRPGMAQMGRGGYVRDTPNPGRFPPPPPPPPLPTQNRLRPHPVDPRGGVGPRRTPTRILSPAPRVGVPAPPDPRPVPVPDLRFDISESTSTSSDSESVRTSPAMMPVQMQAPPPLPLRPRSQMPPPRVPTPRTIVQPIAVYPSHAVARPEFEAALDGIEDAVEIQLEEIQQIKEELNDERMGRVRDAMKSNTSHHKLKDELDEEIILRQQEEFDSRMRQEAMKEDIRELRERTKSMEYENRRTKDTLISMATTPKTPLPVIINNTCSHRPNSRKGFEDDSSSDSGFGRPIRPIGPGPPGPPPLSSASSDDYFSPGAGGRSHFGSPPSSPPNSPPFKPSRGPLGGPGMTFPEGSLDEASNDFQTASSQPSPRTTPRPPPLRRASIDYPMPPPPQGASIPPHARPSPPQARYPCHGFSRPQPRGPLPRSRFLRPGERYSASNPRSIPDVEEPPSPKFRNMPPVGRFPSTPRHISGRSRRSREDLHSRPPPSPRRPPFPDFENYRRRGNGDQEVKRGKMRRGSDARSNLGLSNSRGRNESVSSNHVSFAPSDQYEWFSAPSQGFDEGSMGSSGSAVGFDFNAPAEFQSTQLGTSRRNSFHNAPEGLGFRQNSQSEFQSETMSEDGYSTGRVIGMAQRSGASATAAEPWVDGERERYLRSMQRVAEGIETILSQDSSSGTSTYTRGDREGSGGSGGSGVDPDGRFRYDRFSDYGRG